jgi:hydroxymethylglutaryl-CoA lyase
MTDNPSSRIGTVQFRSRHSAIDIPQSTIEIIECPRDAFQGLPRFIPTPTKIEYLLSLIEAGFTRIDFGSFVSSKVVPQMQDTREVFEGIQPLLKRSYLIAIVPNLKGLEKAIDAGGIHCAGFPLSVSETFQQRNVRQSFEQAWRVVDELLERSGKAGVDLVIYLSMAFGNPYGDPWSPEQVLSFAQRLVNKGVQQISFADTVGKANPRDVYEVFHECRKQYPQTELGVHLHGRLDTWEDVILAAYDAGCRRFDGALLGIGGCPFAEDELVGNIPTERLIRKFKQMGVETGLSEEALQEPLSRAWQILQEYGAP